MAKRDLNSSARLRRDSVLELLASQKRALHVNEIATRLDIEPRHYTSLQGLLQKLAQSGTIVALPGQHFRLKPDQIDERKLEHEAIVSVNPRGFGFVSLGPNNILVPQDAMKGALHGDKVIFRVAARSRRMIEGEIVRIVARRHARIAGLLRRSGKSAWLEPDDDRIRGPLVLLPNETLSSSEAKDGSAAVAQITRFPELADENPEGILVGVLGIPGIAHVEVAKILLRQGIEEEHNPEAIAEATSFGHEVPLESFQNRIDLTTLPLLTIDPEDARDHDDAVCVMRDEDGCYHVWIAIADVSYYVKPGSALDRSAVVRGNSIYLPDRAIPMLPPALSSDLGSLVPNQVRLCLCVEIELNAAANVIKAQVIEGFMRSVAKLTYPGVARALRFSADASPSQEAESQRDHLRAMWELACLLRSKRMRRGALDFDIPEAQIVIDPNSGLPVDVKKRSHDPGVVKAYRLIEELMLLANETVADLLIEHKLTAIFRCHPPPQQPKLEGFSALCHELDIAFDPEDATDPKRLSNFLKKINADPHKQVLHKLLLRAMSQAYYDTENVGHFGLASKAYVHFTSPIRRYPDIVVHRAIRQWIRHEHPDASQMPLDNLQSAAASASANERKGMEIEREITDLYRALLMRRRLGESFQATVTGIVGTGLYVTLDDPFVDVLVRLDSLGPDSYEIDDNGLRVVGLRSGDRIALGDTMLVQIEDVAILRRTVYGRRVLAIEEQEKKRPRRLRRRRSTDEPA